MSLILYFLCLPSVKLLLLQRRCVFYYYNAVFLASFGREGTIKADCDAVLFFMTLCLEVVNHFLKDNWCLCSLGESCLMFRSHTHDFHNGEIQCFFLWNVHAAWILIPLEVQEVLKGWSQGNVWHEKRLLCRKTGGKSR